MTKKGFTLLELLIVIAILGILSVSIITAINVIGNLNKASLARAKTFSASVENALSINQVGKWSFEDGAVDTAKDTSGWGNNGDLGGSGSVCPGGANCPTWKNATECGLGYGGCLSFDGVDDLVTIPDSPSLRPQSSLTVAAWIKPDVVSGPRTAVDKRVSGYSDSYVLGAVDTQARFCAAETGVNCANGDTVSAGVWQYLTGIYDGTIIRTYINGVQVATLAWTNPLAYSAFPVLIGVEDQSGSLDFYFDGFIDEVAIYNQALFSYQIQHLYAQGLPKHQLSRSNSDK